MHTVLWSPVGAPAGVPGPRRNADECDAGWFAPVATRRRPIFAGLWPASPWLAVFFRGDTPRTPLSPYLGGGLLPRLRRWPAGWGRWPGGWDAGHLRRLGAWPPAESCRGRAGSLPLAASVGARRSGWGRAGRAGGIRGQARGGIRGTGSGAWPGRRRRPW